MNIIISENYEEMSRLAANYLYQKIKEKRKLNLGLATGSTPLGLYQELIRLHTEKPIEDFNKINTFNLDEYVGIPSESEASYRYFMNNHLFYPLSFPIEQTFVPSGSVKDLEEECERYEQLIEGKGGIDVQILGVGKNGHIGFNEPGTNFSQPTHIVQLTHSTRKANARFFNAIDEVPTKAITMGISTIMKAKEILLLASGKTKSKALFQLVQAKEITTDWPVTILKQHPHVTVIIDQEAASLLRSVAIVV